MGEDKRSFKKSVKGLMLLVVLLPKSNLMLHTPRHEGGKACEDKSKAIKGKHHLLMTFDIPYAHEINRQTKRKDSPDTQQMYRAISAP